MKDNSNRLLPPIEYNDILELAKKKYSGKNSFTRMFVIGNPDAGKSSLVEALKREGVFDWLWRISESSVPLHTAGIVPSTHKSMHHDYFFFDFAGEPEYYSSHSAILENLTPSKVGDNIAIIVVDVSR